MFCTQLLAFPYAYWITEQRQCITWMWGARAFFLKLWWIAVPKWPSLVLRNAGTVVFQKCSKYSMKEKDNPFQTQTEQNDHDRTGRFNELCSLAAHGFVKSGEPILWKLKGFHVLLPLFGKTVRKDGLSLQYVGFSMRCFPHGKRLWYQDTGGRLLIETASTLTFTAHLSPHQRFLLNSYHVFLSSADSIVEFLPFVFWMQIQMCQSLDCLGRVLRFAIVICIYNRINNHMAGIIRMLFAKQGLYCFVAIRQLCAVMFLFNHSLGFLSVWPFWKRWQLVLVNYMLLCGSK